MMHSLVDSGPAGRYKGLNLVVIKDFSVILVAQVVIEEIVKTCLLFYFVSLIIYLY